MPRAAFSGVRQAGQSRVFGGDFQGARRRGTGSRVHPGRAVRPQGDCGAGHRRARTQVPALLSAEWIAQVRHLAVECYRAVECEGMARVDFFLENETGRLYINEINTIPGFTSISMYPKMWEHSGIGFSELLDRLIALALDRDKARKATRFTR